MDSLEELIKPITGVWTPLIIVATLIAIWAIKTVPGWFTSRAGTVHGSPSSAKYWRARFAEALAQHDKELDQAERDQLAARVTEARVMVEAHEAKRRIGIGGVVPLWILVTIFGVVAVSLITSAAASDSAALRWWAALFGALMIGAELFALYASSAGTERFNVLVAAGRFGRSDLVREDPWRVLREYDHARHRTDRKDRLKVRAASDKKSTSRWTRFERGILGINAWQNGLGLSPAEIWEPLP